MEVLDKIIDQLVFDPINARKHPVKNIEAIKGSLTKFGQQKPIVINSKGIVIAGNGTLMAAKALGWKTIKAVVSELDDLNQMAFSLADNHTSDLSEFDTELLIQQLAQLELNDFDIDSIGFEDFEIPDLKSGNDGLTDPDDVPEVAQNVFGVKRGDVWILGNHRLMCGDSTSEDDVKKLMDGQKADMVFTSPPYNGNTHIWYGPNKNFNLYQNNEGDNKESGEYINFLQVVLKNIFENTSGFIFWNINYNNKSRHEYLTHLTPYLSKLWETVIWKKTGMPISNGLTRNCEFIFVFKNGERKHLGKEFNTVNNLWEISNINSQHKEHKACFPVELPEKGILIGSNENEVVFEPFCGSGSTLIACEKTGRICCGMELDEHYCSVIIKRWQDFTGKQAVKDGGVFNG
jgi:DNA modification methylase